MSDLPDYVWLLVLVPVIAMPIATSAVLHRGAIAAGMGRRTAGIVAFAVSVVWLGWIAMSAALAQAGVFRQDPSGPNPWFAVALLGSMSLALLATRIPVMSRILAGPGTPSRLAVPQTFRVAGLAFLVVMMLGQLPAVFALPAGIGDVAIGLAAPFVAWRLSRGSGRRRAVWFNILGILDLVVAVGIGVFAGLGPTQLLSGSTSTSGVTLLPLVLVPTTAVPLAIALHVISLRRLKLENQGREVVAADGAGADGWVDGEGGGGGGALPTISASGGVK